MLTKEMKLMTAIIFLIVMAFLCGIMVGNAIPFGTRAGCEIPIEKQIVQLEEMNNISGIIGSDYVFCTRQSCYHSENSWMYSEPAGEQLEERT